jgi:hypothetical protein
MVSKDASKSHRVEGEVVDDGRHSALFEQSGMWLHIRSPRDEHRSDRSNNENSEANSSTSRHTNTVTHDQAEQLSTEEGGIIGSEGWQTDLTRDVFEAVDCRSADAFSPYGKYQANIVDPLVDAFQVEVSKACAIR